MIEEVEEPQRKESCDQSFINKRQEDKKNSSKTRVKVAIRVRPLNQKQIAAKEEACVDFASNKEIILGRLMGKDKSFGFDRVFNQSSQQNQIYSQCVKDLVSGCFEGYNAAVLAYGQTGSGKTHTMGTASTTLSPGVDQGIIPRVIHDIFQRYQQRVHKWNISIRITFLEIYNEEIIDLLKDDSKSDNLPITIHERNGQVFIDNAKTIDVASAQEALECLKSGGTRRTTSKTEMNNASSRSHAIFTVFIEQQLKKEAEKDVENECIMAKFFFVDLAGSERIKKTGASGSTMKEGININLGLLQLGNVISALAVADKKEHQFITYRNSKLTRILQDCLGGNSNTYMIACIGPAQSNFQESLNTLRYATKAMNIKNKPVVNTDPISAQMSQYKQRIAVLQIQNRKLKQTLNQKGVNIDQVLVSVTEQDQISSQLKLTKAFNAQLAQQTNALNDQLRAAKKRANQYQIKNYQLRRQKDMLSFKLQAIYKQNPSYSTSNKDGSVNYQSNGDETMAMMTKYQIQIQNLQAQVKQRQATVQQLQIECQKLYQSSRRDQRILISKNKAVYALTKERQQLRKQLQQTRSSILKMSNSSTVPPQLINNGVSMTSSVTSSSTLISQSTMVMVNGRMLINQASAEHHEQVSQQIQESALLFTDSVLKQHQNQLNQKVQQTEVQMEQMNKLIMERQQFLEKITADQIILQSNVIAEMKNGYYQQIAKLEAQLEILHKQQTNKPKDNKSRISMESSMSLNNTVDPALKQKIEQYQNQLKDYKKKEKEQRQKERSLMQQDSKIKELTEQIKRFKTQKMDLHKKLKEDKQGFQKLKQKRLKELMQAKKDSFKKDVKIRQLVIQKKRQVLNAQKREKQIVRMRQINEKLKASAKHNTNSSGINSSTTNINTSQQQQNPMTPQLQKQCNQTIRNIAYRLITAIDFSKSRLRCEQKLNGLQNQLIELINEDASNKIKLERLKLAEQSQLTEQEQQQKQKLQMQQAQLKERIQNTQDSMNYVRARYNQTLQQYTQKFDYDSQIYYKYDNMAIVKMLLKQALMVLQQALGDNSNLFQQYQNKKVKCQEFQAQVQRLREQVITLNTEYQANLARLREQMYYYQQQNSQQQDQCSSQNNNIVLLGGSIKRIQEKDRKILEKKVMELTKNNRQLALQTDTWKRKYNAAQQKCLQLKSLLNKQKHIPVRVLAQKIDDSINESQQNVGDTSLNQSSFLNSSNTRNNDTNIIDQNYSQMILNELNNIAPANKWDYLGMIKAQMSILSMAVFANLLISTGSRSLKVWDLVTSELISNLSGTHLAGQVKHVIVDPMRNMMLTACQRNVTVWDIINLNVVGTFKAHKDEVRCLHIHKDTLFSGGKGLVNSGGLMVWDLRKIGSGQTITHPIDQKQKNLDILTLASHYDTNTHQNVLYYGTRNHFIRRMNINTLQTMPQLQPPHLDGVTALTVVRNSLISGSKDKFLKLWSLDSSSYLNQSSISLQQSNAILQPPPLRVGINAASDHITSLQADCHLPVFYMGARDGSISVGGVKNERIKLLGSVVGHSQSVNAICSVQQYPNSTFVTASADKTIKLWQPTKQTLQTMEKQKF